MDQYSASRAHEVRMTATHIFFWGSVLSNWHKGGNFSGNRALEIAARRLEALNIAIPSRDRRASQYILRHSFSCGEQFMMACKAWLFDKDPDASALRAILAATKPADQKALGRKVPGFNEKIWEAASIEVVVASQITRAEVDPKLAIWYQSSGSKGFVEGSPYDKIWGVSLRWDDKRIEDQRNWRGKNKLGVCHGLARKVFLEQKKERLAAATVAHTSTETPREDATTVVEDDTIAGDSAMKIREDAMRASSVAPRVNAMDVEVPGEEALNTKAPRVNDAAAKQAWAKFAAGPEAGQET